MNLTTVRVWEAWTDIVDQDNDDIRRILRHMAHLRRRTVDRLLHRPASRAARCLGMKWQNLLRARRRRENPADRKKSPRSEMDADPAHTFPIQVLRPAATNRQKSVCNFHGCAPCRFRARAGLPVLAKCLHNSNEHADTLADSC